jgi:hypothetical protein
VRIVLIVVVAALLAAVAPPPAAAVQQPSTAEAHLLTLVNEARVSVGRVRLLWDDRLADVAQGRSDDQAKNNLMAHDPNWADMINDAGITWYRLGETLVKTPRGDTALEAAAVAMDTWRKSQPHWDLLSSADFNYIAIGMARATDGWYYWTALLLRGPDRTPPTASMVGASFGGLVDGKREVRLTYTGSDVQLSSLTAGLRDFKIQRKVGSNSWKTITKWRVKTARTVYLKPGKTYQFRVRARDWAGNKSSWSVAITVQP